MIKIYKNNDWSNIDDNDIINNYINFVKSLDTEKIYDNYIFIKEGYYKTFIIRNNEKLPIANWNDVKVFLYDVPNPRWVDARLYQTWAFYRFLYNNNTEEKYASKNSFVSNHIEIPYDDIDSNIIFKFSYNENGSISYEKNDYNKTRIRISNNSKERSYYQGFYNRMTSDLF